MLLAVTAYKIKNDGIVVTDEKLLCDLKSEEYEEVLLFLTKEFIQEKAQEIYYMCDEDFEDEEDEEDEED